MMKHAFLCWLGSLALAIGVATPALAQTKLKFAHVYETSEPYHKWAVWAAGEIKQRTAGRYEMDVFPASQLGKELAQAGVLVNCVTPAAAKTAIFDQMTQQHIDYMLSKIPMARFVEVDEIAALVCWLASEDCSFSTGGTFDISGGRATY